MKHLILFLTLLTLASCSSTRRATSTTTIERDSINHATHQFDSIMSSRYHRDSIYVHDSIYIFEKGDTVTKYVEKVRYKWQVLQDTVIRDRIITDTLYVSDTEYITVEKPVYIEKELKWFNKGFLWIGKISLFAIFLYISAIFVRHHK